MLELESLIKSFTVRVNYKSSGVLYDNCYDKQYSYVFTAKHCIEKTKKNNKVIYLSPQEISIEYKCDHEDKFQRIRVYDRIIDERKDLAILLIKRVEFEKNIGKIKRIPLMSMAFGKELSFRGYPKVYNNEKASIRDAVFKEKNDGGFIIELSKKVTNTNDDSADYICSGFSGSGVFQIIKNKIYLVGIISKLEDKDASFDEVNCCSLINIDKLLLAKGINRVDIQKSEIVKKRLEFQEDIDVVYKIKELFLNRTNHNLGESYQIDRTNFIDKIKNSLNKKDIAVIIGEPRVGKSATLKLLAEELAVHSEVLVFSVKEFSGKCLREYLSSLNIQNNLDNILAALESDTNNYILIDGIEDVIDKEKQTIIDDIISEFKSRNDFISNNVKCEQLLWKMIFTCRTGESNNLINTLATKKYLIKKNLSWFELDALNEKEIIQVANQFPKLQEIVVNPKLHNIINKPLILDILIMSAIENDLDAFNKAISESGLFYWFWNKVIRLSELQVEGKGTALKRENILFDVAQNFIKHSYGLNLYKMDEESMQGLVSDRIINVDTSNLFFVHDTYREWTFAILFEKNENRLVDFITEYNESYYLMEPLRLFCCKLLEIDRSVEKWAEVKRKIDQTDSLGLIWKQIILTSPLTTSNIREILAEIFRLYKNEKIFIEMLQALRKYCVELSNSINDNLDEKNLIEQSFKPIYKQWNPVINFCLSVSNALSEECLFEFSLVVKEWIKHIGNNEDSKEKLSNFFMDKYLKQYEQLELDKISILKKNIIEIIMWCADVSKDNVIRILELVKENDYGKFTDELILNNAWKPLCKYIPEEAACILSDILIIRNCSAMLESISKYGIRITNWGTPSYFKGPFLEFLRMSPSKGLRLIHNIINAATNNWTQIQKEKRRTPIAQNLNFYEKKIQVWGDEEVYYWYRYSCKDENSKVVLCALLALEKWINEQLQDGVNIKELFVTVLKDTNSLAIVGVCCEVACRDFERYEESILYFSQNTILLYLAFCNFKKVITKNGGFKDLDLGVMTRDIKKDENYDILFNILQENMFSNLIFVAGYLVHTKNDRFLEIEDRLTDNVYFFENEKKDREIIKKRHRIMDEAIAMIKLDGYKYEQFNTNHTEDFIIRIRRFYHWARCFYEKGKIDKEFTLEEAVQFARDLEQKDDINYMHPMFGLMETRESLIVESLVSFVSALIRWKWDWVKHNNIDIWCRSQILKAIFRPDHIGTLTHSESDFKIYAASTIPLLVLIYPKDKKILKALFKVIKDKRYEVRKYVFIFIRHLWEYNPKIVWECINSALRSSLLAPVKKQELPYLKIMDRIVYNIKYALKISYYDIDFLKMIHNYSYILSYKRQIYKYKFSPYIINASYLFPILFCIPESENIIVIEHEKLDNLLYQMIKYRLYYYSSDKYFKFEMFYDLWLDRLYLILANYIILFPRKNSKVVELGKQICKQEAGVLKQLLRKAIIVGQTYTDELAQEKFIDTWKRLGELFFYNIAIKSDIENRKQVKDEITTIMSLLIFVDGDDGDFFLNKVKWDTKIWNPLHSLKDFILLWCQKSRNYSPCFESLIVCLNSLGKEIKCTYKIDWLYNLLVNSNIIFNEEIKKELTKIVYHIWVEYQKIVLKKEQQVNSYFLDLLNILVDKDLVIAVEIQKNLKK